MAAGLAVFESSVVGRYELAVGCGVTDRAYRDPAVCRGGHRARAVFVRKEQVKPAVDDARLPAGPDSPAVWVRQRHRVPDRCFLESDNRRGTSSDSGFGGLLPGDLDSRP